MLNKDIHAGDDLGSRDSKTSCAVFARDSRMRAARIVGQDHQLVGRRASSVECCDRTIHRTCAAGEHSVRVKYQRIIVRAKFSE